MGSETCGRWYGTTVVKWLMCLLHVLFFLAFLRRCRRRMRASSTVSHSDIRGSLRDSGDAIHNCLVPSVSSSASATVVRRGCAALQRPELLCEPLPRGLPPCCGGPLASPVRRSRPPLPTLRQSYPYPGATPPRRPRDPISIVSAHPPVKSLASCSRNRGDRLVREADGGRRLQSM